MRISNHRGVALVVGVSLAALVSISNTLADNPAISNPAIKMVLQPASTPLVSFRILFLTGAVTDPPGQEGLAALTAAMLAKGGTRTLTYDQIIEAMYPLATSFDWQVDKEMTVFSGATHRDNLDRYYSLIRSMLLEPGFRLDDFKRLKADALNYLRVSLRESNDEELGKEELYNRIYAGHPYGHHNYGTVRALERITLDDVRAYYQRHYRPLALVIGLAGGYPDGLPQRMKDDFSKLPAGLVAKVKVPAPPKQKGWRVEIIQRETRSTAISLGFPIEVRRGDRDWPALALVTAYFGQHRSSNSYLYQRLREERGLNYGDYAYLEYFPRGMYQFEPSPNLGRQQQVFQIWLRPVEPQNGHFALRAAWYEYEKLRRDGLSREAFEATREFLSKYVYVLLQTQDSRLGYALDSRYYGLGPFDRYLCDQLAKLTLEKVNQAIRRHLRANRAQVVIVTKDAAGLQEALVTNKPSPIKYNSPKPQAILDEDAIISNYPIPLKPDQVKIVPVDQVFE
jgi:zinc protease